MPRTTKQSRPRPLALVLIEGWGVAPAGLGNVIAEASPEYFNHVISHYPVGVLEASGEAIGLAAGRSGGSEVGHTIIGSGRRWRTRAGELDERIGKGLFGDGPGFTKVRKKLAGGGKVHFVGLVSSAEQLSALRHFEALLQWSAKEDFSEICIHAILDGRDCAPTAGQRLVANLISSLEKYPKARLASLVGRFYAMDEKHNRTRLEKAFELFSYGKGNETDNAVAALTEAYEKKIFDEEFPPTVLQNSSVGIQDEDVVIFWNYDEQGLVSLIDYFVASRPKLMLATLTDYGMEGKVTALFPKSAPTPSLAEHMDSAGWRQLRLSDSAGFPGVSKWLDAGKTGLKNVEYELIPTPASLSLDEAALETLGGLKKSFREAVNSAAFDFIAVTLAQLDTAAHRLGTEKVAEIVGAIDGTLKSFAETITAAGGALVFVGTHGFAERLIDGATGLPITTHSLNPVPFGIIGRRFEGYNLGWPEAVGGDLSLLKPMGSLTDVAPTLLSLADLPIPKTMTGKNLARS